MQKKTLLLVDDDELVRDVIRGILESEYTVLEASSCAESKELSRHQIDLAIIDYILPDGTGFDVLKTMRTAYPTMPAIIITAHGDEDLVIEAMRREVTDYIRKPVQLSYLRSRLSEIFDKQQYGEIPQVPDNREEIILDTIRSFIEKNYMKDLSLDVMARMACMSKFKFCKLFKHRFGRTYISQLNDIRLREAAVFLERTHMNISEIAYAVGYRSIIHFNRLFKAAYKVSPGIYRKKSAGAGQ